MDKPVRIDIAEIAGFKFFSPDRLDRAIGVHTHAGCPGAGNSGTPFTYPPLSIALNFFPAPGTVYVDAGGWGESGSLFDPFWRLPPAIDAVVPGRIVSIAAGSYPASSGHAMTISKAVTLQAPVGAVTIGN